MGKETYLPSAKTPLQVTDGAESSNAGTALFFFLEKREKGGKRYCDKKKARVPTFAY